jgi:diguanylate cyclase (GGDEF)-like protein
MARKQPPTIVSLIINIWMVVCAVATAACLVLAIQLLLRLPPLEDVTLKVRLALTVPAVFGGLAGLYGIVATIVMTLRANRIRRLQVRVAALRRRAHDLEAQQLSQRARIDRLATLREVATVVNYESDFSIIAEKCLEFIDGLLSPLESVIFMWDEDRARLKPFAQYANGKAKTSSKIQTRSIPDFDMKDFERHSVICRVHGQELQGIVPLKVEEEVQGVLFLLFPTDSRPAAEQQAEFNSVRRPVLIEIAHHISLAVKTKYLHTKAVVDGLTRLYTRSHFDRELQAAIEFSHRSQKPFSLILIDIDHFKKVNDTYGHATGDVVLRQVANRIQGALRKYDTAYRYGGEELAVLLPGTAIKQASTIAERLRGKVEAQKVRGAEGKLVATTVSLGVAQFQQDDDGDSLFRRADERLYQAKSGGRNQVVPAAA